ncbi:MAG: PTS sugar transporter subunit IIA [Micrococcales bacterium]|nr:PTS sugar transporter subunit IIA [Micrococcales bacterium]NBR62082.1 PTS sugar transporter subunit IIA [Actinomycetota bacterium]NBR54661.1 PTS sugar transporter subunit IIA [Micrococcales bacterium]NBT48522.1 PTS sugar transporter subunit IIA [Actinomycetota bacterium]NBY43556.1 PTS sugar transporter subunit IIA [Micrococcales bacterium]
MAALNLALGPGSVLLNQTATSWQHAVELAGSGLISSSRVLPEYSQAMIAAVEELGPYMVIAPGIALAHARPSELVLETGLALVTLTQAIEFGSERFDPVRIVFAIAAKDHESHIDLMAELSELLLDEESITILLSSSEESQVRSLFS